MTELVILRCLAVASLVWFLMSEYLHWKQLASAYKAGFKNGVSQNLSGLEQMVIDYLKEHEEDLRVVVEAMARDNESRDAKGAKKA